MTVDEATRATAAASQASQRAMCQHQLALQAFGIACARYDWALAEKEHQLILHHLDAYLVAVMSCHKISQAIDR